jgi:hypothetical protein
MSARLISWFDERERINGRHHEARGYVQILGIFREGEDRGVVALHATCKISLYARITGREVDMAAPDPALSLPQFNEGKGLRIVHENNVVAFERGRGGIRVRRVSMQVHALAWNQNRVALQPVVARGTMRLKLSMRIEASKRSVGSGAAQACALAVSTRALILSPGRCSGFVFQSGLAADTC